MRWLKAVIELREQGAIGEFTPITCKIQAESFDKAHAYLLDDAQAYGWEPRAIKSVVEITKVEYDLLTDMPCTIEADKKAQETIINFRMRYDHS